MVSCGEVADRPTPQPESRESKIQKQYTYIVEIDSCEYIVYDKGQGYGGAGGICHKANCKYCAERKNKLK